MQALPLDHCGKHCLSIDKMENVRLLGKSLAWILQKTADLWPLEKKVVGLNTDQWGFLTITQKGLSTVVLTLPLYPQGLYSCHSVHRGP